MKLSDGTGSVPVKHLLKDVFGFRHDFLVIAGAMVVAFATIFAMIFAYAIKAFKFQKRWQGEGGFICMRTKWQVHQFPRRNEV